MRTRPIVPSPRPLSTSIAILALWCTPGCRLELCADPMALTSSPNGTSKQPIIGGSVDRTNRSTVALLVTPIPGQDAICSGTVIARNGDKGFVLTAAHCVTGVVHHIFEATDWRDCVPGGNPAGCAASYSATAWMPHPAYDPTTLANDFGIIEFSGATEETVVTPAVNGPDGLSMNDTLTLSGYGRTYAGPENPSLFQSLRHDVNAQLASLEETRFTFDATTGKTACFGDSGSPAYSTTSSGMQRVVGVASAADLFCEKVSTYGRVSKVYSSFIAPVIEAPPPATPSAPDGACAACIASNFEGNSSCAGALADCQGNSDCNAVVTCVKGCTAADSACYVACETPRGGGIGLFQHLSSCTACSACDQQCGGTACGWSAQPPSTMAPWSSPMSMGSGTGNANGQASQGGAGPSGITSSAPRAANTGSASSCIPATLSCSFALPQTRVGAPLLAIAAAAAAFVRRRRRTLRS